LFLKSRKIPYIQDVFLEYLCFPNLTSTPVSESIRMMNFGKYFRTKSYHLLLAMLLLLLPVTSMAQLKKMYGKADYPFWMSLPADSTLNSKPPILVFLHGRSLSGNDLELVKGYGVITEIVDGRIIPAIVVAPQLPKGSGWEPSKVLTVIEYIQKNYNTDSNRLYVVGMSLGGYGVLHFVGKYPDKVAAAIALCGGGNVADACNLAKVYLWIQHGKLDKAVPFSESQVIVDAIKKCGGGDKLTFTVYDNYGHSELARCFRHDDFYEWLFSKTKGK
jgi:predicted peptidase